MALTNIERFNFYKYENELKKGIDSFKVLLDKTLKEKDIEQVLNILKASGLAVNIFNNSKRRQQFKEVIEHIIMQIEGSDIEKISNLLSEIESIEYLFESLTEEREGFFKEFEQIHDSYKVAAYLISLELYLSSFKESHYSDELDISSQVELTDINTREALFNSAIESSGMILKYFKFKQYGFKGIKRNISPKTLKSSWYHIFFSEFWNTINEILEYWQYSDVSVKRDNQGKIQFEIMDENFELNNVVSNERFLNLRQGWQMGKLGQLQNVLETREKITDDTLNNIDHQLDYLFAVQYFGDPFLEKKVNDIKLIDWIRAYRLLTSESKKFLKGRGKLSIFNLDKVCICKPNSKWEKLFQQNGFTRVESKEIIRMFTFEDKSQDLIDCPLIKFDENLVLIPSLTSNADPSRALASNFLNRNINLAFRGPEFEERMKASLDLKHLKNSSLYKKTNQEYECDIAFVLDDELYFIECKAHIQPFTVRQHANHLYKLYEETYQLNRIADFYEENINFVIEQLELEANFKPKKVHRILLTTSMMGAPIFVNGVYMVDESSLVKFISRKPPLLKYFDKGKYIEIPSTKFDIYRGPLDNEKFYQYLSSPPQIEITKDLYRKTEHSFEIFNLVRQFKINQTIHVGVNLSESESKLIKKHFR
ncbi:MULTISPECIES: hypothetical protein [Lysinibacillus]|uniref:hypothetical protein n=1 Tax=Lysinibacillus TaxID=400634 RepID=UPI00083CA546|nr:hypothetical protein [Lysinibacillus xylanilyticus]